MTPQAPGNDVALHRYDEFCKKILGMGRNVAASPRFADPKTFDWEALSKDMDPSKRGEYTLNPETANIDWKTIPPAKIKKLEIQGRDGSHFYTVAKLFISMHSDQYLFPGIELVKYLVDNPDYCSALTKAWNADANMNFFGSIVRDEKGMWRHFKFSTMYSSGDQSYAWPLDAEWNKAWESDNDAIIALEK